MTNEDIGLIIKKRRTDLGITLEEIGSACGVSKSTVSRWESGMNSHLKRSHIEILSNLLHMPVERILGWETSEIEEPAEIVIQRNKIISLLEQVSNQDELERIERIVRTFVIK